MVNIITPRRLSKGAERRVFVPDADQFHDRMEAAALAAGYPHLTAAFAVDYTLDHERSLLSPAERRCFDRERPALAADLVARLPPGQQRAYEREREISRRLDRKEELAAYAAAKGHPRHAVPLPVIVAFMVDRALAAMPRAERRRRARKREAMVAEITAELTQNYIGTRLAEWEPEGEPS